MSKELPENLKYTKDHEWAKLEDKELTIGITDFAQSQLGDVVYIELPEVGDQLKKGSTFGVVESIKSVSDLYAPLSGKVIEVNQKLQESPEQCNQSPYQAWFVKLRVDDPQEINELLNKKEYLNHCEANS